MTELFDFLIHSFAGWIVLGVVAVTLFGVVGAGVESLARKASKK